MLPPLQLSNVLILQSKQQLQRYQEAIYQMPDKECPTGLLMRANTFDKPNKGIKRP
jgi:hypothetical protein